METQERKHTIMEKSLTHRQYRRKITLAVTAAAVASVLILLFFAYRFLSYLPPSEDNTVTIAGKVADVYVEVESETSSYRMVVALENGEKLSFVHHNGRYRKLVESIGYDEDELGARLVGREVEICRLERYPWIVRLSAGDTVIDYTEETRASCIEGMAGSVLLALLVLSLLIAPTVVYVRKLREAEKLRAQKEKRNTKRRST